MQMKDDGDWMKLYSCRCKSLEATKMDLSHDTTCD
jgi:hypothetical protein